MSGVIGVSPNMKSGEVGTYPAGHVLQVASHTASSEQSHDGSSWALKAVPLVSLILKGNKSKILVLGNISVHGGGANNVVCLDYRRAVAPVGESTVNTDNISGETYGLATKQTKDYWNQLHISFLDSPNADSGVTVSYQFVFRNYSGTTVHYLGHSSVEGVITISEIAT